MKTAILCLLRIYQKYISPLTPPSCRFYPTCSHYAVEAVQTHGTGRGLYLTAKRLVKCGPWHPGGFDPVPVKRSGQNDTEQIKEEKQICCDVK